jgi:hypothetical protein
MQFPPKGYEVAVRYPSVNRGLQYCPLNLDASRGCQCRRPCKLQTSRMDVLCEGRGQFNAMQDGSDRMRERSQRVFQGAT